MLSFYDWRNNPSDSRNSKQGRPRRGLGRGPMIEPLEKRCLLSFLDIASSGSGSAEPGPLSYVESGTGSALPNELSIVSTGTTGTYTIVDLRQTITLSQSAINLGWTGNGTNTVTGPVSSVTSIAISSSNSDVNNLTIGSIDAPTTITGFQAVNLGQSPAGGAATLAGIRQTVSIEAQTGQTTPTSLTLDDSGGTVGQNWTIAPTSVSGASPAAISWTAGQVNQLSIRGGGGNNTFAVNDTSATTSIDPGAGTDSVAILGTTNPLSIASQPAGPGFDSVTLTAGPAIAGALSFTGNGGQTGLTVSAGTTTAAFSPILSMGQLTGLTPQPIQFSAGSLGLIAFNGGGGTDTLTVDFSNGNPIPAFQGLIYDGGPGSNTLVLQGGSFTNETYRASGSNDGSILLDSSFITFDNLTPILDTVPVVNFSFVAPDNITNVNVVNGPISQGFQTTRISSGDTPAGFELIDFANKTNVTVDLTGIEPFNPPGQVITLNTPTAATGLASLTLLSSISDDQINVVATAPGVVNAIDSGLGNDLITVRAAGLGAGGSNSFDGGTGTDTLTIDAGGAAVAGFTESSVSIAGAPPITIANLERVNIINAANPSLTPIPVPITGSAGFELNEVVGRFLDADPNEQSGNFTATINWGDNTQPTAGIVSGRSNPEAPFDVFGNHTYANPGTYPVAVQVVNPPSTSTTVLGAVTFAVSDLGGSVVINSVATIASPTINATPIPITVVEDQTFTRTLATFTVSNFPEEPPPGDVFALVVGANTFTATIDWGDGTAPSAGTIREDGEGVYSIDGTHLYLRETAPGHPYIVRITVVDVRGVATTITTTATVLSNDIVTTEADSGPGSLRAVINDVNADQIPTTIRFNIPGAGPHRIAPLAPLPVINYPVDIDGTSQPGFRGNPLIELSGNQAGAGADGLTLAGGNSTVRSLVVNRFGGIGLLFENRGGNRVVGNRIGTDLSGTQAAGNGNGLQFQDSPNNTIGGLTPAERNIISGNLSIGLSLAGSGTFFNHVMGNFIGTDVTGQSAIPNFQGVVILGAAQNLIGGVAPGMANLISGNASAGLQIFNDATVFNGQPIFNPPGVATGNVIQGNLIGTNAQGTGRLGNAQGIFINDASGNLVGGSAPGAGNVISGNRSLGVQILGDNATGNAIIGNFIGTNRAGARGLGNSIGVFLYSQTGNFVAPNSTPGGNVIRFNSSAGVETRPLADGPQVERTGLLSAPSGATIGMGVIFTTYLDNARALNPANYIVSTIGRNFRPGPRVPIASVEYNEVNRFVTLIFASPIPRNTSFRIKIVGTAPNGLTDRPGNFLDGNPDVVRRSTGSDFQATFIQGVQVQNQTPVQQGPRRRPRRPAARAIGGPTLGTGRRLTH